jgi:hypothetical protein
LGADHGFAIRGAVFASRRARIADGRADRKLQSVYVVSHDECHGILNLVSVTSGFSLRLRSGPVLGCGRASQLYFVRAA